MRGPLPTTEWIRPRVVDAASDDAGTRTTCRHLRGDDDAGIIRWLLRVDMRSGYVRRRHTITMTGISFFADGRGGV